MCVKCDTTGIIKVSYREVSVKALNLMNEVKKDIRSNGETVKSVEWFIKHDNGTKYYLSYITYAYFDGYSIQEDFIQTCTLAV